MNVKTLGIDIAKNVFQIAGMDEKGKIILVKRLSRQKLMDFVGNFPPCVIGIEACGGSQFLARKFTEFGHDVKLMSPEFVKPYVKGGNKNDVNDAQAICEAVTRPTMRFVSSKSIEQQDLQSLHRIRERLVEEKVGLVNQIRGLLLEYGIVIPQGIQFISKKLPEIIDNTHQGLTSLGKRFFQELYEQFLDMTDKIKKFDRMIQEICHQSALCQELIKIEGIGPLTATALVASIADARAFKNGRQLSAYLGLVPRQHSSGNKHLLLGISKRGDKYLRKLLIHGARSVISNSKKLSDWITSLIQRRGKHKAYTALANKNARRIWAVMVYGTQGN